ncbi:unnamed protein product [Echinostoma caproni]|uniref:BHLH domain-containing protein n=1 Tax=Echinostoma caproni TaxID=27848 RepID=A0A183B5Z5_9TREM|nr:unnamed protein product [Echinostoma caproni]
MDARVPKKSMFQPKDHSELNSEADIGDDAPALDEADSEHCSFSLLDSDEDAGHLNDEAEIDHSGSRPDCTNMSSSLTDAIVSSPSSSTQSMDEYSLTRLSEPRPSSGRVTRAKSDRRTAKQLTERKRRDRINALLDTLRTLILRLLRKNPRHHRKLEKADILELVVSFLKRELHKSRHQTDPSIDPKSSITLDHARSCSFSLNQDMKTAPQCVAATPDVFPSPPHIPITYPPTPYDPYASNFTIPISQLPPAPYMLVTDPSQNPVPYPASGCPIPFYPFKSGIDTNCNLPESTTLSNTITSRRPLGSIENMNRNAVQTTTINAFMGYVRSPTKDRRPLQSQTQSQVLQPSSSSAHISTLIAARSVGSGMPPSVPGPTGPDCVHKTRVLNDENQGSYSHLQSVLGSTAPSQTLWRPYV